MSDDEKLTKIEIRTDEDGEASVETPWVFHVGPNRYKLDNLPFYAYRLSWGDIVEGEIQEHGFPLFVRVVEKSGNRTVRVIVEPPADESEENKAAIEHLITMGCSLEWANPGYVVVNVPADTNLEDVAAHLTPTGLNWEYADPTWEDLFGPEATLSETTKSAADDFSNFLGPNAIEKRPLLGDAVRALADYYEQVRYAGCDRANDGDMLLFQYGVYDWGDGSYFELDFVRQFITGGQSDEPQTEQLHLTFFFKPELGSDLEPFTLWSVDCRNADDFSTRIRQSRGFQIAESESPLRRELRHEAV